MENFKKRCGESWAAVRARVKSRFFGAILDGLAKAVKTAIRILKLTIPIYLLTVLLKYSPIMPFLVKICRPVMKIFNLPPEAALPLVTGFFTDQYGVIAALHSFDFDVASITIIMMISTVAHSLPVEGSIAMKLGMKVSALTTYRVVLAVIIGIIMGLFWGWIA